MIEAYVKRFTHGGYEVVVNRVFEDLSEAQRAAVQINAIPALVERLRTYLVVAYFPMEIESLEKLLEPFKEE